MPWRFSQTSGLVTSPQGWLRGKGYAGRGEGLLNPILQDVRQGCRFQNGVWVPVDGLTVNDCGPCPRGWFTMGGLIAHDPECGVDVIVLNPDPETEMFGRDLLRVHGDLIGHIGENIASKGCIVTPHQNRLDMWWGDDHRLEVTE